jgi:outer membrane lipoprotein SlyB
MKLQLIGGGALAVLLSACGSSPVYDPYYPNATYGQGYYGASTYGDRYARYDDWRVTSIEVLEGRSGGATGAGAVIGGIAGGVIGHQIGSGRGNDAATVAGAIGGAIVGNQIERNRTGTDAYRVTVRGPNGNYETYYVQSLGSLRVGDRVRVANGNIYPIG